MYFIIKGLPLICNTYLWAWFQYGKTTSLWFSHRCSSRPVRISQSTPLRCLPAWDRKLSHSSDTGSRPLRYNLHKCPVSPRPWPVWFLPWQDILPVRLRFLRCSSRPREDCTPRSFPSAPATPRTEPFPSVGLILCSLHNIMYYIILLSWYKTRVHKQRRTDMSFCKNECKKGTSHSEMFPLFHLTYCSSRYLQISLRLRCMCRFMRSPASSPSFSRIASSILLCSSTPLWDPMVWLACCW